jgi:peptide/nickel transport system permease protein
MSAVDVLETPGGPGGPVAEVVARRRRAPGLRGLPLQVKVGAGILGFLVLVAVFAPLIAPYGQNQLDFDNILSAPSLTHLMGTDSTGRDVFSRTLYALRVDLAIVLVVTYIPLPIGVIIGAVAGYFGGLIDEALMRITEIFLAFPTLILSLAVAATLGPSLVNVMISIGIVSWPGYARLLRGQILAVKNFTYVEAAYSVGVPPLRVLGRHVLPNAIAPLIAQVSLDLAGTLLTAASLGFLGLGAQPPTPEWGTMVSSGLQYTLSAWWYPTFPGLAIFVTALCLNSLGEYLRDVFAPETVD